MRNLTLFVGTTVLVIGVALALTTSPSITLAVVHGLLIQCWDKTQVCNVRACPSPNCVHTPLLQPRNKRRKNLKPQAARHPHSPSLSTQKKKKPAQQLLERSPATYVYSDDQNTIYAAGPHRDTGKWPFVPPGTLYWNFDTPTLYVYPGNISPEWYTAHKTQEEFTTCQIGSSLYPAALTPLNLTRNRTLDSELNPKQVIKYFRPPFMFTRGIREKDTTLLIDAYYTKSPYEHLAAYAKDTPLRIDTQKSVLPAPCRTFLSNTSTHYRGRELSTPYLLQLESKTYLARNNAPHEIVFRLDARNIPLVIDELDKSGKLVRRHAYTLQDTYTRDGVQNTPTDPRMVLLPPHIIVSLEEWTAWMEDQER